MSEKWNIVHDPLYRVSSKDTRKEKCPPLLFNGNYYILYLIGNKKEPSLKEGLLVLRLLRCMKSPSFLLGFKNRFISLVRKY